MVTFCVGFTLGTRVVIIPVCPVVPSSAAPGYDVDITALSASLLTANSLLAATSQVTSVSTFTSSFSITALVDQSFGIRDVGQHLRCIMAMMARYVIVTVFTYDRV